MSWFNSLDGKWRLRWQKSRLLGEVTRRHFFKIFWLFWSICFNSFRKYCFFGTPRTANLSASSYLLPHTDVLSVAKGWNSKLISSCEKFINMKMGTARDNIICVSRKKHFFKMFLQAFASEYFFFIWGSAHLAILSITNIEVATTIPSLQKVHFLNLAESTYCHWTKHLLFT